MSPRTTTVLIIGSGLSGLTLARALKHHSPIILEARERIGGRAYTVPLGGEQGTRTVDVGCAMVHGWEEGNPMRSIIEGYGGNAQVVPQARNILITSSGVLSSSEANALQQQSASHAFTRPSNPSSTDSVGSLLLPTLPSPDLEGLARGAQNGAGIPLEQISAKWHGFARNCAGTDAMPVGGYSATVVDKLADEVKGTGGSIELGTEVLSIEDLGNGEGVKVKAKDGREWVARYVVSTIPLGVLAKNIVSFSPPLPTELRMAIQRTTVGVLEKVVLSYDEPWWIDSADVGGFTILATSTEPYVPGQLPLHAPPRDILKRTTLAVQSLHRIAPHAHSLLVYLGAESGRRLIEDNSADEIAQAMHSYLISKIPVAQGQQAPAKPTEFIVTDWVKDRFSYGATSTPVAVSKSDDGEFASPLDFVILSRSIWGGKFGFAGEHTDMDHRGSVVGAIVSGEREAKRIDELLSRNSAGKL